MYHVMIHFVNRRSLLVSCYDQPMLAMVRIALANIASGTGSMVQAGQACGRRKRDKICNHCPRSPTNAAPRSEGHYAIALTANAALAKELISASV